MLEAFPVTANGKVDRAALPAPDTPGSRGTYVAPRTPAEERMAAIWAEVLGVERVGAEDNFFELGGHSLLATQLVSRVREAFRIELPLRAVFEAPTLAELTGRVEALRAETPGDAGAPPLVPVPRDGSPLPLSFAQQRLWFIDRLEPGSATYNLPVAWRLGGVLDEAVLERALGEIVRRHEALRTTFAEVDGSPVQVIAPFGGFAVPVEDLSGLSEADREAALRRRVGEEAVQPFDLAAGPLFRAALLRLGEEDRVLLLSMHHIVSDGWSMGVLYREFSALYAAYREGGESPLPELAVQYADYAVWQREQLEGEALERQLSYWRERLAGAPELLELPTDHPRPAVQTFRGAVVPVELSLELLERLQALGRSEGATLYMTLLGAFQVLLGRYAGSEDVVVGSPIAGRTRGEVEELIGFFVNTLVLRTDLSGDLSFRETLRRVREATLGAYAHQELPFEKLVAELQPERSLSHSPLFQVMFTLQDAGGGGGALPGLKVSGVAAEYAIAKFDLSLTLEATPRGLRGGLNYSTDLFERGTIERMLGHLARVLEQAAARPEARLSELDLLSAEERALVVDAWNRTAAGYPADRCIHELFEAQAARTPGAVAVRFEEESLTYAELNERANRLAHSLAGLGVRPETRVALCLERGPEMVVAVLAVLKAGGAYVPLDPTYPAERLAFVLADAAVPVLVTQESLRAALSAGDGVAVVSVDGHGERIAAESAENPARGARPDHLAYVIYTSGSTGTPKGVLVQHGSLSNLLAATREAFGVGEGDVMPAMASYAFDIWLFEALLPLTSGAAVRLVERDRVLDVPALVEEIADATLVHAVPALMRQLVQAERETPRLARLRRVFVGGERVPADLLAEMREAFPRVETHVLYGPTEGTVLASTHPVSQNGIVEGHPIGRPLGNVRLYVCDALGSPQPIGGPGELLIGGAGVARGYLGQPDLTAERFVPDPFGGEPGARLYRTGDRARWRVDGTLEYLGRLDFQVKVRGFRIELGEIESALLAHPSVREAVVLARGEDEARRLVAWVVADGAGAAELRAHLAARLPEYMVPAAFVAMDALPLTRNGKVDRRALPDPADEWETVDARTPETPTQELLAGVWRDVLGAVRPGPADDFFELGGHSLLALRIATRVRAVFGAELPVRAVFDASTLRAMAARIDALRAGDAAAAAPPLEPAPRDAPLPLSYSQERLWLMETLAPGALSYGVSVPLVFPADVDADVLARALAEVVRRHEALRTVFRAGEGERDPEQVVLPPFAVDLPVDDLRAAPARNAVTDAASRAQAEPFDLERGPLLRARLLRLDDASVLLVTIHHIVFDGWSGQVLEREVRALAGAFARGEPSPLAPLPVQYADFAVWQRRWLESGVLGPQVEFWRHTLAGAPDALDLPLDRPRPAIRTHAGARRWFHLPTEVAEQARALARREGATLYMVLLAAFDVLMARLSGSDDVVVGTQVAGRTAEEVEGLIGIFVNGLALRTDLSGDPSFREAVARVRRTTLDAYAHSDVPFQRLVDALGVERTLSHPPVYNVSFILQAEHNASPAAPRGVDGGAPALPEGPLPADAEYELAVELLEDGGGGLIGAANYSTEIFDDETVARLLAGYGRLLAALLAAPDARISAPAPAEGDEAARVLALSAGPPASPTGLPLHRRFAAWAARTPDAPALRLDGGTVTYAELNARANRIAHHLRAAGVGPESRVGVSMERSADLVAAFLGILKAGGAYVPLDPSYPAERLGFMAADAGVEAVVTVDPALVAPWSGGARIVCLACEQAEIAARPEDDPEVEVDPEGLAHILYTSGTTGLPKGVAIPHRAVDGLFSGQAYARYDGDTVSLHVAPAAFDATTLELWGALLNGGSVAIHPAGIPEPERLGEFIHRHGVTIAWLTAGLFHQVVDAGAPGYGGMRQIMSGGDVLSPAHVRRAAELLPGVRLMNGYGPTETTVFATTHLLAGDEPGPLPVGRPIAGAHVYVLDAFLRPVPVGVPGELYVGGSGVARGFAGRPALTAERFVPDPFGEPGARLYRTGDRGRWNRDGEVEFLGRVDRQVKLRGFRIEPGEVEAVLRAHPAVSDAVVDAHGRGEKKRLVAWVVPSGGARPTPAALLAHAAQRLPGHLVPAAVVVLDALPLTVRGKVDRRALPDPEFGAEDFTAPRTPTEEIVAGTWADLLGVERVGVDDDFFHLGGHSLLATRAASRLRALFGVDVPLRALFEHPTVRALAAEVDRLRGAGAAAAQEAVAAPPVPDGGEAPVSFAQERMWFLDRLEPGNPAYHVPLSARLRGPLDAAALHRALEEVVRRHQALRTAFPARGGVPVQRVSPPGPVPFPVHDLRALPEGEREEAARQIARRVMAEPFDLERGPLFRAELARLGDEEHGVFLSAHHAVSDGWSVGVLLTEWTALYSAFARGEPSPLPEPALQYPQWAAWQRGWLHDDALEAQLGYWRRALAGAPPRLELPTDRPRPAVKGHLGALEALTIPRALSDAVAALGRREGSTLFMVLLAALDVVLQRWSGQDDVVVGTPIAGRTRSETEAMIGLFLNTLALRADLSGDPAFTALLGRVRATTLDAYAHQDVPFERVLEEVHPERTLSHSPVFQVMLNLANFEMGKVELDALSLEGFGENGEPTSKFDFTLYAYEGPEGIVLQLMYDPELYGAPRMRALLAQLQAVLGQAADDPARPLSAFSLATDEAASVLPDASLPLAPEPWRGAVHETFAARAAASPDAPAVADAGEMWTYGELDAAANRIAHALAAGGVQHGDVVAVWAHRSPALVRALLGAWKAGAAFAILDPAYPPVRLAAQVRAAKPSALLRIAAAGEVPEEAAAALAESARATVVLTADGKDGVDGFPSTAPAVSVGPDDLAYVAFTSGTTGAPKAIAGTHRPLAHFFGWYARELGLSAGDRVSLLSGLAHDPLLRDVFAPLTTGGRIVIPDPDQVGTPGWLAGWMRDSGVTVAHLTPAMGQILATGTGDSTLPALRLACFGADVLRATDVERLRAIAPNAEAVNFYGATETPQAIAAFRVPMELAEGGDVVPVGRGIEGVDLLVVTPSGTLAGIGELGEIAVRTPYLSRGYLNDAELTAARFVANP
ncbi:MAG: amino acid adenylation domain-containing protein, partial [Longimicrobiaceae bacterium]